MKQAIKFMIEAFLDANGNQPPSKIIWYRGGASVGSLQTILKNEFLGKSTTYRREHWFYLFYFQLFERFWNNGDQIINLESLSFALFETIVKRCSQQMKKIWLEKVKMFQLVLQWPVMVVVPLTHFTSISVLTLVLVQSIQHFIKSFTMTMISSLIML